MPRLPRSPAFWYAAFAVAFVVCRAGLFAFTAAAEYNLYKDYGDYVREKGLADLYLNRPVEYPQLVVLFGSLAGIVADSLPPEVARLRAWRPDPPRGEEGPRYEVGLGIVLFAVDVSCLLLVHSISRRIYPNEGLAARLGRLVAYTAMTGAVGIIMYDRQDLVVAWFSLLAILAFLADRRLLAYALLVTGTAYKLVPILLLPVFVFAAAAVRAGPGATPGRYLRAVAREAAVGALILALWPGLTYLFAGGERAFVFLTYHIDRGLQIEAPAGWAVLVADPAGTHLGYAYGSYTLRGRLSDRVADLCMPAMVLGSALGALMAARGFWRMARQPNPPAPFPEKEGGSGLEAPPFLREGLGRGCPEPNPPTPFPGKEGGVGLGAGSSWPDPTVLGPHLVAASLLVCLVFVLTNKVGSPQYMLWVAPLAPLMPLRTWASWVWAALLTISCALAVVIFPCVYGAVRGEYLHDDPPTWAGPTWWALFLLAAKSVTLTVVTLWLAAWVWRSPGPAAPPAPEPAR